jgi:hypothetical protein
VTRVKKAREVTEVFRESKEIKETKGTWVQPGR